MEQRQVRVSVIIPNWNGADHLVECLDALANQTLRDFEVVVVDNGSTDRSLALMEGDYPWVRVIANGSNLGFSAAVNVGILATASTYVVLLNNDTRARPDWLEQLVAAMDAHPEAAFGASKMLLHEPPHHIDSAGDRYSLVTGGGWNIGAGETSDHHDQPAWVFGACAGAAIYRRSLFEDIGLFDEDFFLIFEDVDIDLRAQVGGHRCLYVPAAVVYHKRGASTDLTCAVTTARAQRNMIWVAGKNLPPLLLLVWLFFFSLRLARHAMVTVYWGGLRRIRRLLPGGSRVEIQPAAVRARRREPYLKALREGFARLPEKRREVRPARRLGSLALLPVLLKPIRPVQPLDD